MSTPETPTTTDPKALAELIAGDDVKDVQFVMQRANNTRASAQYGGTNFYFGPKNDAIPEAAKQYDRIVLEPGHYKNVEVIPGEEEKAIKNPIAYVPLSGLTLDNASHRPLLEAIGEKGLLRDANGNVLIDPDGPQPPDDEPTMLIDWRQRHVQEVMADHVKSLMKSGYKGVMFDAADTVINAENANKAQTSGVSKAMMGFVKQASAYVRKTNKEDAHIVFNGGISNDYGAVGLDMPKAIGEVADTFVKESQYSRDGKPMTGEVAKEAEDWIVGVISRMAQHSKGNLNVTFLEPNWKLDSPQAEKDEARRAVPFTKDLADKISQQANLGRDKKVTINATIIMTDYYENPQSVSQTAKVAGELNAENTQQKASGRGV